MAKRHAAVGDSSEPLFDEEAALLLTTLKWGALGVVSGVCTGAGTRFFLWTLNKSDDGLAAVAARLKPGLHPYLLLPIAIPACAWIIRRLAPEAKGHGTEQVIKAVHERHGKMADLVAPVKLVSTVLTLAFGGSVGKEGPAAQIGAGITNKFADFLKLNLHDRRKIVICGISAGFAAVFGTPISGAIFGVEVLYLGQMEYSVLFPSIVAGVVAHLVCGSVMPMATVAPGFGGLGHTELVILSIVSGVFFGLVALTLILTMDAVGRVARRFAAHPNWVAAAGGVFLVLLYSVFGDSYAGLGLPTIDQAMAGTMTLVVFGFLVKIVATAVTLETGGSGGIVTSMFFIGAAAGAGFAKVLHLPVGVFAAFGLVAVVSAAANTPIAAAVMALELLPAPIGVYAALSACTAFLFTGTYSVYPTKRLGLLRSARLESARAAHSG
ncbi:MAG TPA: chloride channel protein [Elusimicrobiota bacterium]|jgi:H+/Cl- antiporter ClcA|nr:chloride channel protein [Elusimicrobiota bacterium]